jgi:tetratricopeptide (TPR) repeat protein
MVHQVNKETDDVAVWHKPFIFADGGAVQAKDGYYVKRKADDELLELCRKGEYAYVLAPRQLGKSSLMLNTAETMYNDDERIQSVIVDLSPIGETATEQLTWYGHVLSDIADQLQLDFKFDEWKQRYAELGSTKMLELFLRDAVLRRIPGSERVVIFLDEIDSTINLSFKDDFFAAIRLFYQRRAMVPEFRRLSFVLIGVATPSDLIQNARRTPFNFGERVDLRDFTPEEMKPLADGLKLPTDQALLVLGWIAKWTGGHPYLTMRICKLIAESESRQWSQQNVEALIADTYFGAGNKSENNLQFVRDLLIKRIPEGIEPGELLITYRNILRGRTVLDDWSLINSHLKLSGVVHEVKGVLQVRNLIYRTVFNEQWIKNNLPASWAKQQYQKVRKYAAILGAAVFLLSALTTYAFYQRNRAEQQSAFASEQQKIAEQQRNVAEENELEAKRLADSNDELAKSLDQQLAISRQSEKKAVDLALVAEAAKQEAIKQEQMANRRAQELASALEEVKKQKQVAELAKAQAIERQKEAEELNLVAYKAKEEADKMTLVAFEAQQMEKARAETEKNYRQATAAFFKDDFKTAIDSYEKIQEYYQKKIKDNQSAVRNVDDLQALADTLNSIAIVYEKTNNRDKAVKNYNLAIQAYESSELFSSAAAAYEKLAVLLGGDDPRSGEYYERAIELYAKTGNVLDKAKALVAAVNRFYSPFSNDPSRIEEAIKKFEEARNIYKKEKEFVSAASIQESIVNLYAERYTNLENGKTEKETKVNTANKARLSQSDNERNDKETKARYLKEYLQSLQLLSSLYLDSKNPSGAIDALSRKKDLLLQVGDINAALAPQENIVKLYENSNNLTGESEAQRERAKLLFQAGKVNEAINLLVVNLQKYPNPEDPFGEDAILNQLLDIFTKSKNQSQAIKTFENLEEEYRKQNKLNEAAKIQAIIGDIYLKSGRTDEAAKSFNQVVGFYKSRNNVGEAVKIQRQIADAYNRTGNKMKAIEYYTKAYKDCLSFKEAAQEKNPFKNPFADADDFKSQAANIQTLIGEIHYELGEKETALNIFRENLHSYLEREKKGEILFFDKSYILETIITLFEESGKYEEARTFFEEELESLNYENKNQYSLDIAKAYFFLGHENGAADFFNYYIKINSDPKPSFGSAQNFAEVRSYFKQMDKDEEADAVAVKVREIVSKSKKNEFNSSDLYALMAIYRLNGDRLEFSKIYQQTAISSDESKAILRELNSK